ncbi:DUF5677 domain-containing protein [Lentzea sp. NPDC042327]|uniref:DUF5677 domain-containing protein n=1 Tax=Lentzea sp. NPDC042327 TaxID=3154801 RepID=UPI0034080833
MAHRDDPKKDPALRATLEELLTIWEDRPSALASVGRGRKVTPARLAVVLSLAAHTHRLTRAALLLSDAGADLEAVPLVRGALEHGLTTQWISQYEDAAVAGFANEHERQRRNFARTLLESGLRNAEEVAAVLDKPPAFEHSSADGAARSFQQLCGDFAPLGPQLYALYRVLSGLTHAGPAIVDSYLRPGEHVVVSVEPNKPLNDNSRMWILGVSCMWASRAADMLDRDRPHRERLRAIARQLGTAPVLKLHPDAWIRRASADRQARLRARAAVVAQPDGA